MRPVPLILLLASIFALTNVPAHAQYAAGKITFAGEPASRQAALEAAANLHTGAKFSASDLQKAAQSLSDTGAFDDVQVTLEGDVRSIAVNFVLKPIAPSSTLEASFGNFYWFTPEELVTGIRSRVPLFGPSLPESGNLIDAVESALRDMLQGRGISAKITHDISEPSPGHQARAVTYRVVSPRIVVRSVHLSGISADFAPAFRNQAGRVVGFLLDDGIEHRSTDQRLLLPYLDAGYITARIADRKLTPTSTTPERIELDLAGAVVPGPLLHISTLAWAGSPELSSAAFTTAAPLHAGSLASVTALEKTTDLLAAPYRKEGYADVIVVTAPAVDQAAATVGYTFTVTPGEQYRLHSITFENLTPSQRVELNRAWQMKAGDLFNPDYITHFLENNSALRSFDNTSASYKAIRDPAAHQVDLTVSFVHGIPGTAR